MTIINQKRWYRPREIAKLGLIQNGTGNGTLSGNYYFVLGLIKTGRLQAKNVGRGSIPYWLISETEIKRYHNTVTRVN